MLLSRELSVLTCQCPDDADVCAACWERHGSVVQVENGKMGDDLPPLAACESVRCRCYFRPEQVSMA